MREPPSATPFLHSYAKPKKKRKRKRKKQKNTKQNMKRQIENPKGRSSQKESKRKDAREPSRLKTQKGGVDIIGGVATQILQWSRNHIYSILLRNDLSDLNTRDMGLEFRYGFRKVFGTQNHPTLGLASFHCVLCLNPIKGILNIAFVRAIFYVIG